MDPNATLEALRATLEELSGCGTEDTYAGGLIDEATDLFNALDQWLSKGGFLPRGWERKQSNGTA